MTPRNQRPGWIIAGVVLAVILTGCIGLMIAHPELIFVW